MSANRARQTYASSESNTLVHALIGGVAGVVLSMVPFSPVLGGAVASYLDGGTPEDGLRIGIYAGLVMLIPYLLFVPLLFVVIGLGGIPAGPEFIVILLFVVGIGSLYTVGLSALGGYLGIYLQDEL